MKLLAVLAILVILAIAFALLRIAQTISDFFYIIIAIGLILGIVAVIIGGIYFFLSSLSVPVIVNVNGFLTISVPLLIMFAIFKIISYRKKKKNINTMNHIRFNSDTLIDDELMNLIENNSIGEFARIGYMAAFADRYPLRKNLLDCKSPKK